MRESTRQANTSGSIIPSVDWIKPKMAPWILVADVSADHQMVALAAVKQHDRLNPLKIKQFRILNPNDLQLETLRTRPSTGPFRIEWVLDHWETVAKAADGKVHRKRIFVVEILEYVMPPDEERRYRVMLNRAPNTPGKPA